MYLIILDDGTLYKVAKVPEEELENADNGLLDVVHIGLPQPMQYIDGGWHGIEVLPKTTGEDNG